jgi:hypothetical protein
MAGRALSLMASITAIRQTYSVFVFVMGKRGMLGIDVVVVGTRRP